MKLMLIVALGCLIAGPVLAQAPVQNNTTVKQKPKVQKTEEQDQETQMKLQMQMDRRNKAMETQSNVQKKSSDTSSTIIQNMK